MTDLVDPSMKLYPVEEPVNFLFKKKNLISGVPVRKNIDFLDGRKLIEQENSQMTNFKILISGLVIFRHIRMNKN